MEQNGTEWNKNKKIFFDYDIMSHNITNITNIDTSKALDTLELQLDQLLQYPKAFNEMWTKLDQDGNGIVSLAEIDNFAVYTYPLLNHKPALMRAYQKTLLNPNINNINDGFVREDQLPDLITNLFYFNRIYYAFSQIDSDGDNRISIDEFNNSFKTIWNKSKSVQDIFKMDGVTKSNSHEIFTEILNIDINNVNNNEGISFARNYILFSEFCDWFATKK